MAHIVICDMMSDRRVGINIVGEDSKLDSVWETEDSFLIDLQTNNLFYDKKRWCDLDPIHYRFLIIEILKKYASLEEARFRSEEDIVFIELCFLLGGLVRSIETRCETTIELVKIDRLNDGEVLFNFVMSANMALSISKPKKGLRVVVDNAS